MRKSGIATVEQCSDRWEKVIQESSKSSGNNEYSQYLKTLKAYNKLLRDHVAIKSNLCLLAYTLDYERIKFVRSKGYNLNLSGKRAFAQSLAAAMRKSDNVYTKLILKLNELTAMTPKGETTKVQTIESLLAALSFELGYTVADDITLARYNEYLKLINRKRLTEKEARQKQMYGGRT